MKTLTLVNAYTEVRMQLLSAFCDKTLDLTWTYRKFRQGNKFLLAITNRLQEQEEEQGMLTLEEVREKYFPNVNFDELCKCPRCKYHRGREWKPRKGENK